MLFNTTRKKSGGIWNSSGAGDGLLLKGIPVQNLFNNTFNETGILVFD
jgi:hypothetical protein